MKKIIAMLLALAMAFGMVACGGGTAEETQAAAAPADTQAAEAPAEGKKYEGVELTMWSMWSSGEPQALVIEEAAAAFEAETGAKVAIEWKGRDINTLLSASLEAGEKFDIFEDDYQRIATTYVDYTYDLTEMAEAAGYADYGYACFNDQVVEWAGYLNSIVEQPQIGGVFYDKLAFETAGIEAAPTTWAEFLDVCAKLKEAGIAPLALDGAYADFTFYHQLVRHLGEDALQELAMNGGWSDSAAVTAAQEVIDFVNAGYLVDGAPDEYPASQNKVGLGQAAMVVCANYVTAEVDNAVGAIDWGFFNYPEVEGGVDKSAYAGANSLAITSYTENAQAAFDFIQYIVTGTYGQKMADSCGQIPADSRLTESVLVGSVDTLKNSTAPMSWCGATNANSELQQSFKDAFLGIYEGKYESGEAFCAALDALY